MADITLDDINTAIATVLKHQKYRIMDREFTFVDLDKLRQLRRDLQAEAREAAGNTFQPVRMIRR